MVGGREGVCVLIGRSYMVCTIFGLVFGLWMVASVNNVAELGPGGGGRGCGASPTTCTMYIVAF